MGFCFCLVSMTTVTTSVATQFIWLPDKSFRVGETADYKSYFIIFIYVHTYCKDSLQIEQKIGHGNLPIFHPFFKMLLLSSFVCMLRATKTKNYPSSYSILSLWLWLDFLCFYTLASQYASNKFTLTGTINFSCVLYI